MGAEEEEGGRTDPAVPALVRADAPDQHPGVFPPPWQRRQRCHSPHFTTPTQQLYLKGYLLLCSWVKQIRIWKSSMCLRVFSASAFPSDKVIDTVALTHTVKWDATGE